ncbi:MAG: YHS domain-containing protein [Desulfurococcaceae archaeon]
MPSAVNPVCGMTVDTEKSKYKSIYKGVIYHFCSKYCKSEFDQNPERYLMGGPKGMPERT